MIEQAIKKINPNAQFTFYDGNIDTIQWLNNTPPIPKEQILIKIKELQAEYEANQYQRDRAKEYPSLADQLDMQYWDKINNTNKWEEAINAVKTKYPK